MRFDFEIQVLWDVSSGCALCGSPMDGNVPHSVKFLHRNPKTFITVGKYHLRVWEYDSEHNKLRFQSIHLGQLRRIVTCVVVSKDDQFAYCGTSSGDVLEVDIEKKILKRYGPRKHPIPSGVTSLYVHSEMLFVGCGDGHVRVLRLPEDRTSKKVFREIDSVALSSTTATKASTVTSVVFEKEDNENVTFFVGTRQSEIFRLIYSKKTQK